MGIGTRSLKRDSNWLQALPAADRQVAAVPRHRQATGCRPCLPPIGMWPWCLATGGVRAPRPTATSFFCQKQNPSAGQPVKSWAAACTSPTGLIFRRKIASLQFLRPELLAIQAKTGGGGSGGGDTPPSTIIIMRCTGSIPADSPAGPCCGSPWGSVRRT